MNISEKIKAISNRLEQSIAQYVLDRQTSKSFALSSGNVCKYEFLTGKRLARKSCFNEII